MRKVSVLANNSPEYIRQLAAAIQDVGDPSDAVAQAEAQAANAAASATAAAASASAASASAADAETAADMAGVIAGIFETTAAGLAATTSGEYFSVPSAETNEFLILYKNTGGTATYVKTYPSGEVLKEWFSPGLLVSVTDSTGLRTWLEATDTDGGPTAYSVSKMADALDSELVRAEKIDATDEGVLFAVADSNGLMTDLAVRGRDGKVFEHVIEDWAGRIAPYLNITSTGSSVAPYYLQDVRGSDTTILGTDSYVRGGEVLSVLPNMGQIVGWGSSSMAGLNTELTAYATSVGATYFNGGKSGERSEHIAARMGAIPALVTFPSDEIPASGVVSVTVPNLTLTDALQSYTGEVSGVAGTLSCTGVSGTYQFTRTTAGSVVSSPAGKPFLPTNGQLYRSSVCLLWMGKNDTGTAADVTVRRTDACFDFLAPLVKRCLVLGHFVNTGSSTTEKARIAAINDAHRKRYGRQFVDVQAYITGSQVWTDTGITPTATDLSQQASGEKPDSLSSDSAHLNAAGYGAVMDYLIAVKFDELGWY